MNLRIDRTEREFYREKRHLRGKPYQGRRPTWDQDLRRDALMAIISAGNARRARDLDFARFWLRSARFSLVLRDLKREAKADGRCLRCGTFCAGNLCRSPLRLVDQAEEAVR